VSQDHSPRALAHILPNRHTGFQVVSGEGERLTKTRLQTIPSLQPWVYLRGRRDHRAIGEVFVNHRIVAALVVGLLAVSCTPDQPEIATRGAGKDPVEPQLRAQKPVDKISHGFEYKCPSTWRGCNSVMPTRSGRRRTEALVTLLRQDKPSWLRYIKAVRVVSPNVPNLESNPELLVQTGIFVDQAGKDMGAVICRAMLEEKLDSAAIYGVERSLSTAAWQPVLARCQ